MRIEKPKPDGGWSTRGNASKIVYSRSFYLFVRVWWCDKWTFRTTAKATRRTDVISINEKSFDDGR